MPVEFPEMFITDYWVQLLMLLQRQLSNLTKMQISTSYLLECLRHLKIATTS